VEAFRDLCITHPARKPLRFNQLYTIIDDVIEAAASILVIGT
jgi:hypothetical protein